MVQMKAALGGIPVNRAMLTEYHTLSPVDRLAHAVDAILSGSQQDFPVVANGSVVGVLTRGDLLAALARRGQDTPVDQVMQREFQVVDANEMLEPAFARLQACDCHTMPVTSHGQLVGLLTTDNIGEFLMIQAAMGTPRDRGFSPQRFGA